MQGLPFLFLFCLCALLCSFHRKLDPGTELLYGLKLEVVYSRHHHY